MKSFDRKIGHRLQYLPNMIFLHDVLIILASNNRNTSTQKLFQGIVNPKTFQAIHNMVFNSSRFGNFFNGAHILSLIQNSSPSPLCFQISLHIFFLKLAKHQKPVQTQMEDSDFNKLDWSLSPRKFNYFYK